MSNAMQGKTAAPRVERAVPYSREHTEARRLDWYFPAPEKANGRCVMLIHGGGFQKGSREQWDGVAAALSALGYVCASVGYRLAPGFVFPAPIEDVRIALDFVGRQAEKCGFDPRKIAVMGSSAGGYLAAMLALLPPKDALGWTDELSGNTPRPAAAGLYCPVVVTQFEPGECAPLDGCIRMLLGADGSDARRAAAAPLERITGQEPPFLFLHGTEDTLVPAEHCERMAARLRAAGAAASVCLIPGAGHGFGYGVETPAQKTAFAALTEFFARVLKS
ncbi:MAG: alpha/beta hydrolase [Planctomycetes bacterium]|nr:alpha/beta hydrolase [Planctomycetota bacterium]